MTSRGPLHLLTIDTASTRVDEVRLDRLRSFADRADRLLVTSLAHLGQTAWRGPHAELAQRMLDRNLAQLEAARSKLRRTIDELEGRDSTLEPSR